MHYSTNLSAGTLEELLDSEPNTVVYVPIKYQMLKKRLHAFKVNGTSMNNIIPGNQITLMPDSSDKTHQPIMINTDVDTVNIIGKVIWHMNPDDIDKTY